MQAYMFNTVSSLHKMTQVVAKCCCLKKCMLNVSAVQASAYPWTLQQPQKLCPASSLLGLSLGDLVGHRVQIPDAYLDLLQLLPQFPGRCSNCTGFRCSAARCPTARRDGAGCFNAKRGVQLHGCLAVQRRVRSRRKPVLGTASASL